MVEEHKNVFENEPVLLTPPAIREAMAEKGLSEEVISKVEEICEEAFGDTPPLAENLIDSKALQTHAAAKKANVLALEVESLKQKLEEKEALPEKRSFCRFLRKSCLPSRRNLSMVKSALSSP